MDEAGAAPKTEVEDGVLVVAPLPNADPPKAGVVVAPNSPPEEVEEDPNKGAAEEDADWPKMEVVGAAAEVAAGLPKREVVVEGVVDWPNKEVDDVVDAPNKDPPDEVEVMA